VDAVVLQGKKLSVTRRGKKIIDIASFSLGVGERVGVVGPNGAGKSTLIQVLAMLAPSDGGRIFFRGKPVRTKKERFYARRKMAVVFQEPLLLSTTVYENVAVGLKLRRLPRSEIRHRVGYWLNKLGIEYLAHRYPYNLSGGEAQRVNLARALVLEPDVLFLDEPLSDLDAPTRRELRDDILEVLKSSSASVLWVTHDLNELPGLVSRTLAVMHGRIVQEGSPEEILFRPRTVELARFVGVENLWLGEPVGLHNGMLKFKTKGGLVLKVKNKGDLQNNSNPTGTVLCVRSMDVTIINGEKENAANNVIPGEVASCIPREMGYLVTASSSCGVNVKAYARRYHPPGERVYLYIPPEAIHLIDQPR